jgi:hypothetical protein
LGYGTQDLAKLREEERKMEIRLREAALEEAAKKRRKIEESDKMLQGALNNQVKPVNHLGASDFKMLHSLISKP